MFNPSDTARHSSVVALAGRRVDAPGASEIRFPSRNAVMVEGKVRECLQKGVRVLVCSAACGSDLLALGVARELGIRRRVVLPFARAIFREKSVVDRPGDWGERYDRALDEVEEQHDLVILGPSKSDADAFAATNEAVTPGAPHLAPHAGTFAQALVVSNGQRRASTDHT